MDKQVLILGAAGRFGLAAARAFAAAGWRVLGQVRARRPTSALPAIAGVNWLPCDIGDRQRLLDEAAGSQVLIHALNPAYTNRAWAEQAPAMLQQSIDLAAALGATLMLPGNVYNFGADMPAQLREDTPQRAAHVKGRVRIAMEQALEAAARAGGLRAIVIRAGDFFGSGRGTTFDLALAKGLPKGKMTYPGDMAIATAWAYLPDLAQAFVQFAERRDALAPFDVFHFRGHNLSGNDWREALAAEAAARGWIGGASPRPATLKPGRFPWALIRLGAPLVPLWRSLADMRYLGQRAHALDNSKLLALLGTEPHTPLRATVTAAVEELFPREQRPAVIGAHPTLGRNAS